MKTHKMLLYTGVACLALFSVLLFSNTIRGVTLFSFYKGINNGDKNNEKGNLVMEYAKALSSSTVEIVALPLTLSERLNVKHIETPKHVKALYMSAWGASSQALLDPIIEKIDNTELNAIVIDVKDYTGYISFKLESLASSTASDTLKYAPIYKYKNISNKISNINNLIKKLHEKNIYVIARIAVFQDPYMPRMRPDLAIHSADGNIWRDKKSLSWVNPKQKEYWEYIKSLSLYAHDIGFDEINLDYIRFPTDGDLEYMDLELGSSTKAEIINDFYVYMGDSLRGVVPVSADLFGLTTVADDDMGIGQRIESGLINFDFVAPMIYPSHYNNGFKGIANPDASPYQTVYVTMKSSKEKVDKLATSTNQSKEYYWNKMRPWIQDFSLRHVYGINEVESQIKALHDLGIDSYLIWNASNRYTRGVGY